MEELEREAKEYFAREDRRLGRARARWVRRFMVHNARVLVMPRPRQRWYQWRLRRAGRRASTEALTLLLEAGWRERVAAIWLVSAGRRTELRPVIERGVLSDDQSGYRGTYCTALACLGTEDDARILVTYLDQALLLEPEEPGLIRQFQPDALAALLYLDQQLGTNHAQRFLADDGPWHRWPGSAGVSLAEYQDMLRIDVAFATGADPGIRQRAVDNNPQRPASTDTLS